MQENTFKKALANGEVQLGLWSSLCSPITAEIIAGAGFDWILFDTEHSPIEVASVLPLLQAATGGTASHAVRPAWNDRVLIKKVLDIGAQTILIPFVQTADEAAEAVKSCRYPPDGLRGVAGSTRASRYGRTKDYLHKAQDEICILVQVETGSALEQLDAIANIDGIDGVFIGPSDLSASLGHLGNPAHEDVQKEIEAASKIIRDADKAPGILAGNAEDSKRYISWGFQFVACSTDSGLLTAAADNLVKVMRG
jgi:4-hydroxy-2-oxoheptanedioate aldolase